VRGVLFDLDGTLVDSAADLGAALNKVRAAEGLAPVPLSRLRPYVSHGARGLLAAGMGVGPDDAEYPRLRDAFLDHYASALCVHTAPFEGIPALLAELKGRGLRWGVVTNKSRRFTEPLMHALAWETTAGCVVCGDSTANAKPHPGPLLLAGKELDLVPEECVYVGDAERDVQAANAAGMYSLVAEYGYIPEEEKSHDWRATGWIASPPEVLSWLPPLSAT